MPASTYRQAALTAAGTARPLAMFEAIAALHHQLGEFSYAVDALHAKEHPVPWVLVDT
jgi:hypothetical protein